MQVLGILVPLHGPCHRGVMTIKRRIVLYCPHAKGCVGNAIHSLSCLLAIGRTHVPQAHKVLCLAGMSLGRDMGVVR